MNGEEEGRDKRKAGEWRKGEREREFVPSSCLGHFRRSYKPSMTYSFTAPLGVHIPRPYNKNILIPILFLFIISLSSLFFSALP